MMRKIKSIRSRILISIWIVVIPMALLVSISLGYLYMFCQRYDSIVSNITEANTYNMTFRDNLDEVTYRMIVGNVNYNDADARRALGDDDPYQQIADAREAFRQLRDGTDDADMRRTLNGTIRLLNTLEERVDDVVDNISEGGHYDDNITIFNMDITILTGLIQDSIQQYIYESAQQMEEVRQEIDAHVRVFFRWMGILLAAMAALSVMLSRYTTKKIIRPIDEMVAATESYSTGDFSKKLPVHNENELDVLAGSFNHMGDDIVKLIETVDEEEKNKQSLELKLLTAEINPHFLYNTLDTIVWLTEAGENDEAVKMLSYLSDFFRVSLSNGRDIITVEEEERHINSYLGIQQIRFSDVMDYEISIDDAIRECPIVKMTLQPIVENAIYHGVRNMRRKGQIRVRGRQQGDRMVFTVADTGVGMNEEELARFTRSMQGGEPQADEDGHGFGVANVASRLRLYYGDDAAITVQSVLGEGTTVTITIPKKTRTAANVLTVAGTASAV